MTVINEVELFAGDCQPVIDLFICGSKEYDRDNIEQYFCRFHLPTDELNAFRLHLFPFQFNYTTQITISQQDLGRSTSTIDFMETIKKPLPEYFFSISTNFNRCPINSFIRYYKFELDNKFAILSGMLSSVFKKKISPELYTEEQAINNLNPVEYEFQDEQSSKHSKTLYYMPKISITKKIFAPDKWNISNFQIGRHIGSGKYGHVYLARERHSKHIVALKVLSKKQLINSDVVNQLRREIEIHSHLKHENILQMYGFFFDQRKIYIILQYAPGGQLYTLFRSLGRFQEPISSKYTGQMIAAMKHLHDMNIIHRDLKPENILICDQNLVKLSDFGWAVHGETSRKTMCGTIDYIGPEILHRQDYDTSIDMWTIGVLAYELTAGRAPFETSNRHETSKRIKNLDYNLPVFFSPELKDFLRRLLVSDPKKRMSEEEALNHPWIVKYKVK